MWLLQHTINHIYSKIQWREETIENYYNVVVTSKLNYGHRKYKTYWEKVESTRRCLELRNVKFTEFRKFDKKSKKWLVGFRVYYTTKRRIPVLPAYPEIYDELRPKLLEMWKKTPYAAHYVDSIIQYAYNTVMKSWQELYEMGQARKKPTMKKRTIYLKNSLCRTKDGELIITLIPRKRHLKVPIDGQWFLERIEGYRLGAVLIKELGPREKYRVILQYTKEKESFEPKAYISIDLNMDTIDLLLYVPRTKIVLWIQIDRGTLVQWIRRHGKRLDKTRSILHHNHKKLRHELEKLSTRYDHHTDDIIKKLANYIVRLAQLYDALIIVEDLKKQSMYSNSKKKNRELGFRLWKRLITYIKGQWHVKEVNPWKTTKKCSICGNEDTIVQGLQVYCTRCKRTINRQLNACANILYKGTKIRVDVDEVKNVQISIKDIL